MMYFRELQFKNILPSFQFERKLLFNSYVEKKKKHILERTLERISVCVVKVKDFKKEREKKPLTIVFPSFITLLVASKGAYIFPQWINNHSFIPAASVSGFPSQCWDEAKQTVLFPLSCSSSTL